MSSKKEKVTSPSPEKNQGQEKKEVLGENKDNGGKEREKTPEVAENLAKDQGKVPTGREGGDGESPREEQREESKAPQDRPDPDAHLEWPEADAPSAEGIPPTGEVVVEDVQFDQIKPKSSGGQANNIDILLDVDLPISVQLGKTSMTIQQLLEVGPGSVIELDKMVGNPVEILANDKTIAQGEVVVVDENFGVKITSLISPEERIKSLR